MTPLASPARSYPSAPRSFFRLPLLASCLLALLAAPGLHAANVTWSSAGTSTPGGDGNWTGGSTWWDGSSAVSWTASDNATFSAAGNTTVNSAVTVGRITFTSSTANISILGGAGDITLNSGITATNTANTAARTFTISESVALGANQTWTVNNGGATGTANLAVSGIISGSNLGITQAGNGTLTLSGNNTYNGTTTVNAGTLALANSAANNKTIVGNITVSGGTLNFANNDQIADTASVTMTSGVLDLVRNETIDSLNVTGGTIGFGSNFNTINASNFSFTGGQMRAGARQADITLNGPITLGNFTFVWSANTAIQKGLAIGGDISVNAGATVNFQGDGGSWSGINGRITLNANRVIDVGAGANMNVQWGIVGTGGIAKNGTGTLTLSGTNAYNGTTTINDGILRASHATALGATANGTTVASGGALELSGGISIGAEALSLAGTGISSGGALRNISGDNSYAGAITLAAATRINSDAGSLTLSGAISGTQNLTFGGAGNTTVSGNITTSTGTLTKDGVGTLTLSGAGNSYTGTTTINAGTIQINHANALGSSGNITFGGGGLKYGTGITQDLSSRIKNSASAILVDTNDQSVTWGTALDSTNAGGLTKNGTGTLTLSATNTYSGATTINAGTLQIDGDIAGSGLVINSGGRISPGSTAAADSFGTSSITINGGGYNWTLNTANGSAGSGWDQITSTGALTSSGLLTVYAYGTPGDWDNAANYSWDIFSANSVSGFSTANFALDLSNFGIAAGNRTGIWSFSNPSGGIIRLSYEASGDPVWTGGTGNFSTGFSPAASNGDTIAFSGTGGTATNDSLTSVNDLVFRSGAGAYTIAGTALTVNGSIINNSTTTQTFSTAPTGNATFVTNIGNITISGVASGAGRITKNGTATLTLTANNTYTGATTINAGTLAVTGAGRIDSTSGISVAEAATFRYAPTANSTFSRAITGNGTIRFQFGIASGNLYVESNLSGFSGQTIFEAAGSNATFIRTNGDFSSASARFHLDAGAEVVFNGTAQTWGEFSGDSGSRILSTLGNPRTLNFGHLNTDATFAGNLQAPISLVKEGTGTQTFTNNTNNMTNATITINNGTIAIGGDGRLNSGNYSSAIALTNASSTFHYNSTATQILSGAISGAGVLVKSQASTLTLSGNNTYSGHTTINAGTIEIGSAGRLGAGSYAGNISNNGTFIYSGTNAQTLSGILSGTGALTQNNSGSTLTLTGNNTYSGATTINAGTLVIGGAGRLGGGSYAGNITMTGAFTYNSTADTTLSGPISGGGILNKLASGTLTLSGSNTRSGKLVMGFNEPSLTAGTVKLGHNNAVGTGSIEWENDGTLELAVNGLSISNSNFILSRNSATDGKRRYRLDLAGSNTGTFSGAFDVRHGGLVFDVGGDDTLTASNSFSNGAGSGGFEKTGAGTLVLTGATNTLNSNIVISAGTLQIGNGGTTGTLNSLAVTNNGTLVFNRSNAITVANAISGSGDLIQNGSSTLTLTSASSNYTGTTTINAGTISISAVGALGSTSGVNLGNATELTYTGSAATLSRAISVTSGTATVSNTGSGLLTLSGGLSKNGTTLVLDGGSYGINVTGAITGSAANSDLVVDGNVTLSTANSYNGPTTINGNLTAAVANAMGSTTNVVINSGGSLLVGANETINDTADMTLAGGTLSFNGSFTETLGSLTLTANSVIDMGGGNIGLEFADMVAGLTNTTQLNIYNYTLYSDHLYFRNQANLASSLPYISFYSGWGTGRIGNSFIEDFAPLYEVRPVPEPETSATGILLALGGAMWLWRKRRNIAHTKLGGRCAVSASRG
jgi:fibronectin-binding autotransporter adhesin